MSAALLLVVGPRGDGGVRPQVDAVTAELPPRVLGMRRDEVESGGLLARVWSHDASRTHGIARDAPTGSWLALLGNPSRPDLTGLAPDELTATLLRECLARGARALASVSAPFAAVFHDGHTGATDAIVDRCGLQHLYALEHEGRTWLSSSSVALAAGLRLSLDGAGVAEWLGIGHFVSQRTQFRGVRKLGCGEHVTLAAGRVEPRGAWRPEPGAFTSDPVPAFPEVLRRSVRASATGEPLAVEVTGGLDSRLVLATMLETELPFFGWTVGRPASAEVSTVERLRRRVAFPYVVADVDEGFGARLPDLVGELHGLSDGEVSAVEYAPLLTAFEQLEGRRTTSISGSGGENARGYYYGALGREGIDAAALVHRVTRDSGDLRAAARDAFAPRGTDPIEETIARFVADSPAGSPHRVLDDFYLRARMQRFGGRNITTTGMFCRQGIPYFANEFVDVVFSLPREATEDGRLVRTTLAAMAPALAAVPLDSGVPVRPASRRDPRVRALRLASKGRKGLVRYGGRVGRAVARPRPEPVPWADASAGPAFRGYVDDLLRASDSRLREFLPQELLERTVGRGTGGRSLYELGLLVTLELTLRRTGAR